VGYPDKPVGVTIKTHNLALDEVDRLIGPFNEMQQILIELGKRDGKQYIKIPMTPEQVMEQLMASDAKRDKQLEELTKTVADLAAAVKPKA